MAELAKLKKLDTSIQLEVTKKSITKAGKTFVIHLNGSQYTLSALPMYRVNNGPYNFISAGHAVTLTQSKLFHTSPLSHQVIKQLVDQNLLLGGLEQNDQKSLDSATCMRTFAHSQPMSIQAKIVRMAPGIEPYRSMLLQDTSHIRDLSRSGLTRRDRTETSKIFDALIEDRALVKLDVSLNWLGQEKDG